jgi:predicted esterase
MSWGSAFAALLLSVLTACAQRQLRASAHEPEFSDPSPSDAAPIPESPPVSQPEATDTSDAPVHGDAIGQLRALPVPGFLPAVLFVPAAPGPQPLVVANHGAGGAPEYECEYWRRLTASRAVLLCLRGTAIDSRGVGSFYYKNHIELGRELQAALSALRRELGESVQQSGAVYAGFSQGAIMGAPMIVAHAARFNRLALIEGGYEYWSASSARAFARNGGRRVLFVCGTRWCADKAALPADWLGKAGVAVRIEYAAGAGHTPAGEVMSQLAAALPWLLEGDEAWKQ